MKQSLLLGATLGLILGLVIASFTYFFIVGETHYDYNIVQTDIITLETLNTWESDLNKEILAVVYIEQPDGSLPLAKVIYRSGESTTDPSLKEHLDQTKLSNWHQVSWASVWHSHWNTTVGGVIGAVLFGILAAYGKYEGDHQV